MIGFAILTVTGVVEPPGAVSVITAAAEITARLSRAALPLPPQINQGLKVHEIDNSGPLEIAAARLVALLQPVRA